jgi:hypothetical protein
MKTVSICAVAAITLSLVGCANKVDECNALVGVINDNHTGEDRPSAGDKVFEMKRNVEDDGKSVAALNIMNPRVPEVRKLRDDLHAGFKTRLDGEEIIVAAAEASPPDVDKAKNGLARVTTSATMLTAAYASVTAFCKEK